MKVLAKPAFSNKTKNPYNYLLYSQLEENEPCTIEEFSLGKALFSRYDILHFHWPEVMLSDRSVLHSVLTTVAFLLVVRWMKFRGTKFIWTVHDLRSHNFVLKNTTQQKVEQWYWHRFNLLLDAVIALSKTSLDEALKYHPALTEKQHFVIPHGHYKDIYPDTISRETARRKTGIGENDFLITYFGQIRPYKNVPRLISSFLDLDRPDYRLLVAGNPSDEKLEKEVESLAAQSDRVTTILQFIRDEEVQTIFRASDLVVIPYKDILNSGSVILSLSFDVPVLVPEKGSIIELKKIFGGTWIKTYSEELTSDILEQQGREVEKIEAGKCTKIDDFGWDKIAHQTFRAYEKLAG